MSYSLNGWPFELCKDSVLRNLTKVAGAVVSLFGQAQTVKGTKRTMIKVEHPYSYVSSNGGTLIKSVSIHRVITHDEPENAAEATAQIDAVNHGNDFIATTDTANGSAVNTMKRIEADFVLVPEGSYPA